MAEDLEETDKEFEALLDKVGTARGNLRRKLAEEDPELAKALGEMTPEQKAWGRLVGKLIVANSNEEIENAFSWAAAEMNNNVDLRATEKITALFHAMGSLDADEAHYRIIRRMYLKAKMND